MANDHKTIIWACNHCHQKNRIRLERWEQGPKCGSCGEALATNKPQAVDTQSFQQVVLESALPVLVDFWAPWCGPCRMIAPALEELAKKHHQHLLIVKVNTDEEPALGSQYKITGIPALLLFQDGKIIAQQAGALPLPQLERWLLQHI